MIHIRSIKQTGNIDYLTTRLGWQNVPGVDEPQFILKNLVMPNFPPILYAGDELEFTKGSIRGQLKFIKDEIIPYPETRLALVMGLTSVVSSYIQPHKSIGTLVVNVAGKSSTGKSTISELSASMFGDPKTSNYGLVRTFNATKNFLLELTSGRNGLPIILDDANANPKEHDFSNLIYEFDMGESRGRCNSDGSAQTRKSGWSGLVMMTSESPLLDMMQTSKGALVRTLTLNNFGWTQNKEHSDRIKEGVRNNYGFFGKIFANQVSKKGIGAILTMQDKYEKIIINKMVIKDDLSYRMASKLAPFAITSELINEIIKKQVIDTNEIIDMVVMAEQSSIQNRDKAEEFMDVLLSFISVNNKEFHKVFETESLNDSYEDMKPTHNKLYGVIHQYSKDSYVIIDKKIVDKIIKDNNIIEWISIRKELVQKNILIKRNDDHFTWRGNRHLKVPYYKFMLDIYNTPIGEEYKDNLYKCEKPQNVEDTSSNENAEIEMKVSDIDFYDEEAINDIFKEEE